jgi:hypothetical protein
MVVGIVHLIVVSIDLLFLLLLIRALSLRWPTRGLLAFNSMGQPVVDWFTGYVGRAAQHFGSKPLSQRMQLFIGMLLICLIRLVVVGAAKIVFG